ncbi:MAG: homoaconitate hydratase, partial [Candidatus Altarchaeaceae archaeon]
MTKYEIYVSQYNFVDEIEKEQNIKEIKICDTTLRDGEQTAGVVFSIDEKIEIARLLAEFGVEQIEAGIPIVSQTDKEAIKKIVKIKENEGWNTSIMAWSRAKKEDIDAAIDTNCDAIAISLATSDIHLKYKLRKKREEILDMAVSSIEYAKSNGLYVSFNAEDGGRTDLDFLIEFTKKCADVGGDRLRLCDTVSALQPFATKYLVKKIKESVNIPIEIHAHNDYGLAVANSLAAIEGGAEYVSTTINGIGERSGNCSLEQSVMCLKCLYNIDVKYKTEILKKMSEYVEKASNIKVSPNAPIVGENSFRHESGIHVDGLIKFPY